MSRGLYSAAFGHTNAGLLLTAWTPPIPLEDSLKDLVTSDPSHLLC